MANIQEETTTPRPDNTKDNKLFLRLNKWLYDTENHPSETLYREQSEEDYEFYAGRQDDADVIEALSKLKRPNTTYNEVKPKIDLLIGLGSQIRLEANVVPTEVTDEPLAELMHNTIKHYKRKLKIPRKEGKCFEHSVKGGRSYLHYYVDSSNPFKRIIKAKVLKGYECYKDPDSSEYDMSDARFFFVNKWVHEDEIKQYWPGFEGQAAKGSTSVKGMPDYFDAASEKYRLVEAWWREVKEVKWFVNPVTGKQEYLLVDDFNKFNALIKEGLEVETPEGKKTFKNPEGVSALTGYKRLIYFGVMTGSGILQWGISPYRHENFPYIQFGAYEDDNKNRFFSATNQMKDPQRGLNTMRRQLTHLLQTAPKGILLHEAGAVLNIDDYEKRSADPTFHMELKKGGLKQIDFTKQPQISPIYGQLDATNKQAMKDASGVQDPLMGVQTYSREPGITMQIRQESSFAVLFTLFDNYNESRYLSTEMLMSLIQQYVTEEEVIRIEGPNGWQLMQINNQMNRQTEGFNDVTAAEFDLIIDEEAQSKSTRLAIAKMLTDFSQNNPGTIPPDVILEYASIPFSVKQRIREYQEMMRQWELKKIEKEIELKNAGKQGGKSDG